MISKITILIIFVIGIFVIIRYFTSINLEGFDATDIDSEAISNIASVYNKDNMIVTNLNITGEGVANSIKSKQLFVKMNNKKNEPIYEDVAKSLRDLNAKLNGLDTKLKELNAKVDSKTKDLDDRLKIVEKNFLDGRKKFSMFGYTGSGVWGVTGASISMI